MWVPNFHEYHELKEWWTQHFQGNINLIPKKVIQKFKFIVASAHKAEIKCHFI